MSRPDSGSPTDVASRGDAERTAVLTSPVRPGGSDGPGEDGATQQLAAPPASPGPTGGSTAASSPSAAPSPSPSPSGAALFSPGEPAQAAAAPGPDGRAPDTARSAPAAPDGAGPGGPAPAGGSSAPGSSTPAAPSGSPAPSAPSAPGASAASASGGPANGQPAGAAPSGPRAARPSGPPPAGKGAATPTGRPGGSTEATKADADAGRPGGASGHVDQALAPPWQRGADSDPRPGDRGPVRPSDPTQSAPPYAPAGAAAAAAGAAGAVAGAAASSGAPQRPAGPAGNGSPGAAPSGARPSGGVPAGIDGPTAFVEPLPPRPDESGPRPVLDPATVRVESPRAESPSDSGRIDALRPDPVTTGESARIRSSSRGGAGRVPRRASLQLRRLEPWSVLKLSFVLSLAAFLAWMVAVGVLYLVLEGMGVWEQLNGTYSDLTSAGDDAAAATPLISAGRVFSVAAVVGAVNIVLITALSTVGAFIYNVSADLAGGVEVTLSERD